MHSAHSVTLLGHAPSTNIILYAGAEAPNPSRLGHDLGLPIATSGRELQQLLIASSITAPTPTVVIPASTGRDLASVTHAAQVARWCRDTDLKQYVAVAQPVVNHTYTIAQYRKHLRALAGQVDAVVFLAAAADPFADAELFRRVRLAQQFSEHLPVEIAFEGTWPALPEVRERLQRLGHASCAVVRADFGGSYSSSVFSDATPPSTSSSSATPSSSNSCSASPSTMSAPNSTTASCVPTTANQPSTTDTTSRQHPLFSRSALLSAINLAARHAAHLLTHGDDGISAALLADHDQGFAHSHGDEDHAHPHAHPHGHTHHSHAHTHAHAH